MEPFIAINFKTYAEATGDRAVTLATTCEAAAKGHPVRLCVAVQATDILRVSRAVSIPVYAQHLDPVAQGKNTGFLTPEAAKAAGASGTILNHSEHRLERTLLEQAVNRAHAAGLKVIICAATPDEGAELAALRPEFIAVEPPELIGGDVSVSTAEPYIIKEAAERITAPLLVGAGVKTAKDVRIALSLGAQGVLLASGVATAKDPKAALKRLLDF